MKSAQCQEEPKMGSLWRSKLLYPGFGLNPQVHQDGEQSQGGDGSPPRKQVYVRVSIGLERTWRTKGQKSRKDKYKCVTSTTNHQAGLHHYPILVRKDPHSGGHH